jgi:hypothetical protein
VDAGRFDTLVCSLGGSASRRTLLGLLAGIAASPIAADAARRRRPGAEGPCGDGSRKDNICTKDKDCCTGICNTAAGKKNKDGKGRCRCVRKNGACTEDKNCCGGRACEGGVCGGVACSLVDGSCVADSNCCTDGPDPLVCENFVCVVPVQCVFAGDACTDPSECCTGTTCASNVCCAPPLGACTLDASCCQPLTGGSSTCQNLTVGRVCCYTNTTACLSNSDCCSNKCESNVCVFNAG